MLCNSGNLCCFVWWPCSCSCEHLIFVHDLPKCEPYAHCITIPYTFRAMRLFNTFFSHDVYDRRCVWDCTLVRLHSVRWGLPMQPTSDASRTVFMMIFNASAHYTWVAFECLRAMTQTFIRAWTKRSSGQKISAHCTIWNAL